MSRYDQNVESLPLANNQQFTNPQLLNEGYPGLPQAQSTDASVTQPQDASVTRPQDASVTQPQDANAAAQQMMMNAIAYLPQQDFTTFFNALPQSDQAQISGYMQQNPSAQMQDVLSLFAGLPQQDVAQALSALPPVDLQQALAAAQAGAAPDASNARAGGDAGNTTDASTTPGGVTSAPDSEISSGPTPWMPDYSAPNSFAPPTDNSGTVSTAPTDNTGAVPNAPTDNSGLTPQPTDNGVAAPPIDGSSTVPTDNSSTTGDTTHGQLPAFNPGDQSPPASGDATNSQGSDAPPTQQVPANESSSKSGGLNLPLIFGGTAAAGGAWYLNKKGVFSNATDSLKSYTDKVRPNIGFLNKSVDAMGPAERSAEGLPTISEALTTDGAKVTSNLESLAAAQKTLTTGAELSKEAQLMLDFAEIPK